MHCTAFIICHKLERFLDRAVASVMLQSRKPDAIWLIGTDGREETSEAFQRWPELLWAFSDKKLSCPESKNYCYDLLPHYEGDSAFFTLDADDNINPCFVERILGHMEASGADVIGCDYEHLLPDGVVKPSITNSIAISDIYNHNPLPSCSIIRASAFAEFGPYKTDIIWEDWALWAKMHAGGAKLFRFPQVLFTYCRHGTNLSGTRNTFAGRHQVRKYIESLSSVAVHWITQPPVVHQHWNDAIDFDRQLLIHASPFLKVYNHKNL